MYIADASAFNNEMTKIIRMAWSMREMLGRDRRLIAEAIIRGQALTSAQLQQFAEQEGNLNYPWTVLTSDKTDLPTFPVELKHTVENVGKAYFGQVRITRRKILDALGAGKTSPIKASEWLDESEQGLRSITGVSGHRIRRLPAPACRIHWSRPIASSTSPCC